MTPAEALAAQPPARDHAMWFLLPQAAHGWIVGEEPAVYLPAQLSFADELAAHEWLAEWDALAGKLLREALFASGDTERVRKIAEAVAAVADGDTQHVRKVAEAVAAVAEQLAITLGARR